MHDADRPKHTLSNVQKSKNNKNNSPGPFRQLFPRAQKSKNCRPLNKIYHFNGPLFFFSGKQKRKTENSSEPGDSSRNLFDPLVGGHFTFHHPKKGPKLAELPARRHFQRLRCPKAFPPSPSPEKHSPSSKYQPGEGRKSLPTWQG